MLLSLLQVRCCLVLNKIDRLLTDLQLSLPSGCPNKPQPVLCLQGAPQPSPSPSPVFMFQKHEFLLLFVLSCLFSATELLAPNDTQKHTGHLRRPTSTLPACALPPATHHHTAARFSGPAAREFHNDAAMVFGLFHARRTVGIRMRLPTTERPFWHCGAHTAQPESAFQSRFRITKTCCFRWPSAARPTPVGTKVPARERGNTATREKDHRNTSTGPGSE